MDNYAVFLVMRKCQLTKLKSEEVVKKKKKKKYSASIPQHMHIFYTKKMAVKSFIKQILLDI